MVAFWRVVDEIASVFWDASRKGIKMPLQSIEDIVHNCKIVPFSKLWLCRYLTWTMGDLLDYYQLWNNKNLVGSTLCTKSHLPSGSNDFFFIGLLRCLIEDTVHSNDLRKAPLINSALGISIRSAGLVRPKGTCTCASIPPGVMKQ